MARLRCEPAAAARALTRTRDFAARAGLEADAADRLAIVVEEWVVNVVEHGGAGPATYIVLRLERLEGLVRLTASDAGLPFDPRDAVFSGPDLERGGGAGLELIRSWSRIAGYVRRSGRNRVVLEMLVR